MSILIEDTALQVIITDAQTVFPHECCGFLFGRDNNRGKRVVDAYPVQNQTESNAHRRFVITPRDYMKAERFAEDNKLTLLGIYHSHPQHPAIASETDRAFAQPVFSYVIVSVVNGEASHIRSWLLKDDKSGFDEEAIILQSRNELTDPIQFFTQPQTEYQHV